MRAQVIQLHGFTAIKKRDGWTVSSNFTGLTDYLTFIEGLWFRASGQLPARVLKWSAPKPQGISA